MPLNRLGVRCRICWELENLNQERQDLYEQGYGPGADQVENDAENSMEQQDNDFGGIKEEGMR